MNRCQALLTALLTGALLLAMTASAAAQNDSGSIATGDNMEWRRARAAERLLQEKEDSHLDHLMATEDWGIEGVMVHVVETPASAAADRRMDVIGAVGVAVTQVGGHRGENLTSVASVTRDFEVHFDTEEARKPQKANCSRKGHDLAQVYEFAVVLTAGTERLKCISRVVGSVIALPEPEASAVAAEEPLAACPPGEIRLLVTEAAAKTATVATACEPGKDLWVTYLRPNRNMQPVMTTPATAKVKKGVVEFLWNDEVKVRCPAENGVYTLTRDACR